MSQRLLWEQAVTRIEASQLSEYSVFMLIEHCEQPAHAYAVGELLAAIEPPLSARELFEDSEEGLVTCVDQSDYSLADWFEALACVYQWLVQHNRKTTWPAAFGFVRCSAEFSESGELKQGLAQTVGDMLETYGFEG